MSNDLASSSRLEFTSQVNYLSLNGHSLILDRQGNFPELSIVVCQPAEYSHRLSSRLGFAQELVGILARAPGGQMQGAATQAMW